MIIIVSGLPRSGTSMMMRMLEKAGVTILTDQIRKRDEDNLLGYYEYEPVKSLYNDNSWLVKAEGKAIKIVSPLLKTITPEFNYKVIFMERKIEEILASQEKMMKRRNEIQKIDNKTMEGIYRKHLREIKKWLAEQHYIETVYIDYNKAVEGPIQWVEKIVYFLELSENAETLAQAVNPNLYRQRK
jgi:hypothetical protein